jgi:hypothetical protein
MGADSVTLPWMDFKKLYRSHIEDEIKKKTPEKKEESAASLQSAAYVLSVKGKYAELSVNLSGRILKGAPENILLFEGGAAVSSTGKLSGAKLFNKDGRIMAMLENGKEKDFSIELNLILPIEEELRFSSVNLTLPNCLQNSLQIKLPEGSDLYEKPGLEKQENVFFLSSGKDLNVKFKKKRIASAMERPEIDIFTILEFQRKRLVFNSNFLPENNLSGKFRIKAQEGARFISSSLKRSWINPVAANEIEVSLPENWKSPFNVQFALDSDAKHEAYEVTLPSVKENAGREGDFLAIEPEGADISVSGSGLSLGRSVENLPMAFKSILKDFPAYMSNQEKGGIKISLKYLDVAKAPEVVLSSIHFTSVFTVNGNVMSVLRFTMPERSGNRLFLKKAPDSEIWYLKVNGKEEKVYTMDDKMWIIPMEEKTDSLIELAFIRKGDKMGLHGRLDSVLSSTGLAARKLYYTVLLPEKYELVSADGDVEPLPIQGVPANLPEGVIGKPYNFYRSFYKGEEVKLAVDFREPAK